MQCRAFSEMLEKALRRYQNRSIEAAQVIEELIDLARNMREANECGEVLDLTEDEIASYDALKTNDSAVKVIPCGQLYWYVPMLLLTRPCERMSVHR